MTKWTKRRHSRPDRPDRRDHRCQHRLGFETATALAARGAHVVMAVRNLEKGKQAAARITEATPGADVTCRSST